MDRLDRLDLSTQGQLKTNPKLEISKVHGPTPADDLLWHENCSESNNQWSASLAIHY
jgi:hypothetical protein